jgi:UDPglucose 6-dehydrogenase
MNFPANLTQNSPLKISVFGTGYVGLVTGVCFAEKGNQVICVDVDEKKVQMMKDGRSPIYEPGLDELLKANILKKQIEFTTDAKLAIENSDIIFIAVGTPANHDGHADLSQVNAVSNEIAKAINGYKILITKSTVPVGTNNLIKNTIQNKCKAQNKKAEFDVVSNPEFLREGTAIEDCMNPDRVVIGLDSQSEHPEVINLLQLLYKPFMMNHGQFIEMDLASAEMTKCAANAMLATRISFMNEMSRLCEKSGADIEKVKLGIGSDPRIGSKFLNAGLGYGGGCFPKDVQALIHRAEDSGLDFTLLKAVEQVNLTQRNIFSDKIKNYFKKNLAGKTLAFWGIAFKPGTDDIRQAPSLDIMMELILAGAKIKAFDPVAETNAEKYFEKKGLQKSITFIRDQYEVLSGADALVLVTEWKSFREPDFNLIKSKIKAPVVFDGRNVYATKKMKELGFEYLSVGRGTNA